MQGYEPIRRTSEIEEPTNLYLIHPIAIRLTYLFRDMGISPNAVSVAGMSFGLSAALAYFEYQTWWFAVAGFVLMLAWHVMDGVDGQLARLTQSQSQIGKVLDGICDYVTFTAVYASFGVRLSREYGPTVWALVIAAGACHALQAGAYEVQREEYDFWVHGRASKQPLKLRTKPLRNHPAFAQRLSRLFERLYARLQFLTIGFTMDFHERLAGHCRRHPDQVEAVRRRYRETFAAPARQWSLMSANFRTLGIFICAVLRAPSWYFVFEIFGCSLIHAILTYRQHKRCRLFLANLGAVNEERGARGRSPPRAPSETAQAPTRPG